MIPCCFRLRLALWLAAFPGIVAVAQQPTLPEQFFPQLEAALRQAATQSPRMISRSLDLEMADATRDAYRAGLYPSVAGSYRITESRDDRADQADTLSAQKVYYDVSLTQPVFHWGSVMNNARIGNIHRQLAQRNYREAYRLFSQELRSLYLQLIVKKAQVERGRFNLNHLRELLRVAEDRLAKKVVSEGEVAVARLNAEQAELTLDRAIEDFDGSRAAFGRMIGAGGPIAAAEIPDAIPAVTAANNAFDARLAEAIAAPVVPTHQARVYETLIEQETLNYKIHRARLLPKFNIVAGVNQDEQSYTINTAQRYRLESMYAGAWVSWHIFDGFSARAAQRSSLARRRQIENDLRDHTDLMRANLQGQNRQLGFSARAMVIADRNVNGAEGLLKARREDMASGNASESDVRVAELAVHDAKINAYSARLDYLMKAGELAGQLALDPALSNLPQE